MSAVRRPFEPAGKNAVVTGAGSGIGLAIARTLAAQNGRVVLSDVNEQAVVDAAASINEAGGDAIAMACDVSDRAQVAALADHAFERFGSVDLVVNNAGIGAPRTRAVDILDEDAHRVMGVNYYGVWHGCAEFGKRFIEQGTPAHILNTASENSLGAPVLGMATYTASKHAVLGLSDVLRQELPEHIGVSVLCPAIVATNLSRVPLKEDGEPEFGLSAEAVAEIVMKGLREGLFYIMTHGPVREFVDERHEEMREAFEALAPRFEGDAHLDTRHAIRVLTERMRSS